MVFSVHGVANSATQTSEFKNDEFVIFELNHQHQAYLLEFEQTAPTELPQAKQGSSLKPSAHFWIILHLLCPVVIFATVVPFRSVFGFSGTNSCLVEKSVSFGSDSSLKRKMEPVSTFGAKPKTVSLAQSVMAPKKTFLKLYVLILPRSSLRI